MMTFLVACGGGGSGPAPEQDRGTPRNMEDNSDPESPVQAAQSTAFTNVTLASGMTYEAGFVIPPQNLSVRDIATSGAAAGDYDADGDIDVFIVRGDVGPNLLYRNDGNLTFTDVAESAGLAFTESTTENYRHSGVTFADMDGDGDLDLFMGGLEDPSMLFANNGDGTFTDVTLGSGIDNLSARYNMSAAFGDYDLDGDLDMFVAHWGSARDQQNPGDTQHLWRNDSDEDRITFTSASEVAGISPSVVTLPDPLAISDSFDRTFTPRFARIDADSYPDLLVVADFNQSQFFVNNQDGTFSNATDVEVLIDGNGMGSAVGDYDNDGDLDWFVTSILYPGDKTVLDARLSHIGNRLYRNHLGAFEDVTDAAGVADGGWGWGACFIDFENDGDLDIYHTNGWQNGLGNPDPAFLTYLSDSSRAFVNHGDGTFTDEAETLGLSDVSMGRGVVCADFDDDGDVDILLLHDSATLWRNDLDGNTFLRVKLVGLSPNTEGAGSRIIVSTSDTTQVREIMIGNNFVSQDPTVQVFGLGTATSADVTVQWPDGQETVLTDVEHRQSLEVMHPEL